MEIYRRPHMIHTLHSDVRRRKQQAVRERERAKGAQSNLHFVWNNWQMIHRLGIGIEIEAPIDKRFNGLDSFSQLDSPSLNAPATNPAPTPPLFPWSETTSALENGKNTCSMELQPSIDPCSFVASRQSIWSWSWCGCECGVSWSEVKWSDWHTKDAWQNEQTAMAQWAH